MTLSCNIILKMHVEVLLIINVYCQMYIWARLTGYIMLPKQICVAPQDVAGICTNALYHWATRVYYLQYQRSIHNYILLYCMTSKHIITQINRLILLPLSLHYICWLLYASSSCMLYQDILDSLIFSFNFLFLLIFVLFWSFSINISNYQVHWH